MNFYSEDIIIMREVFSKSSVSIYFLHEKYLFSPGQLARSIDKLISLNVINLTKEDINITDYGIKWILSNRNRLFLSEKNQYWKSVPEYMKCEQLDVNNIYKPNRSLLDYNFFSKIIDKQNGQV